ncbi:MAG: DUF4112 domain-containing protein [Candidatus Absconditabacterales bacterium]
MGGIVDNLNTSLKGKVLGEVIPDGAVVPTWKQVFIEKGLAKVGLKELADRKKRERQGGEKIGRNEQGQHNKEHTEQQEIIKQLEAAKKAANTTTAMAKYTDPTEAIISLFPGLGDAGASITLAAYYHYLGKTVGFSKKQHRKINTILAIDGTVGFVPVIGDILDFVYQGCKRIGELFVAHYEALAKRAQEKGISADVLDKIAKNEDADEEVIEKRKDGKGRETIPDEEFDVDGDGVVDTEDTDLEDTSTPKVDMVDEVAPALPSDTVTPTS